MAVLWKALHNLALSSTLRILGSKQAERGPRFDRPYRPQTTPNCNMARPFLFASADPKVFERFYLWSISALNGHPFEPLYPGTKYSQCQNHLEHMSQYGDLQKQYKSRCTPRRLKGIPMSRDLVNFKEILPHSTIPWQPPEAQSAM